MTYIEAFDPDSRSKAAYDAYVEAFDAEFPNWETDQTDPESRRYVDESDVELVTAQDREDLENALWEEGMRRAEVELAERTWHVYLRSTYAD